MRSNRRFKLIIFLCTMLWPLQGYAYIIQLSQLQGPLPDKSWQLTFTSPGVTGYHAQLVENPARLLVNFTPATALINTMDLRLWSQAPISDIHTHLLTPETLQVIFNLRTPVKLSTQVMSGSPNRLLLLLTPMASVAPLTEHHVTTAAITTSPHAPPKWYDPRLSSKMPIPLQGESTIADSKKQSVTAGMRQQFAAAGATISAASSALSAHPAAARLSSTVTENTPSSLRRIIIVIDPGHGGKDPGASGLHGTDEKAVVLGISQRLQRLIDQQPGFHAVLTRSGDYFIPLRQRLTIARRDRADMFIAIHADAYLNHVAHGASVYALSSRGATSEAAHWIAQRENQSELMGGVDLSDKEDMLRSVLINLSQTATIHASLLIGQNLLLSLHQCTTLHYSRVEQAAFVVLKSPDIPSLLVETGFLSNASEEQRLNDARYQEKVARALMIGITRYFNQNPPPATWLAAKRFPDER